MANTPGNNAFTLDSLIPVDQSIYEVSTDQRAPLGTRLRLGERTYHYAYTTATVPGGGIVCAPRLVASQQSGLCAMAAASVGAKVLSSTSSAAVAANLYAEGYFGVATGTNIGEIYRIKSNAAGSTGFAITLYDGLNTAITSGTGFYLMQNPFNNVIIGSQALDYAVGVTCANVTSGGNYAWLQTWGPSGARHEAASAAAGTLRLGTTGGVVVAFDATTNAGIAGTTQIVGKNLNLAGTAAQANPVFLTILP
jgi:hypothetical protein